MLIPIQPLKNAELPERRKPIFKMMGPGIVMAGLAIGSGELIMWPWITSVVGAQLLWAAAIGIFLQLWVNIEIGRWAVATGEGIYTGFARMWRLFGPLFMLLVSLQFVLPAWARSSGLAIKALPRPTEAWTIWTGSSRETASATTPTGIGSHP